MIRKLFVLPCLEPKRSDTIIWCLVTVLLTENTIWNDIFLVAAEIAFHHKAGMMMFWGPNLNLSFRLLIFPEHLSIDLASSCTVYPKKASPLHFICLSVSFSISSVQNKVENKKPNEMHQHIKCAQEANSEIASVDFCPSITFILHRRLANCKMTASVTIFFLLCKWKWMPNIISVFCGRE